MNKSVKSYPRPLSQLVSRAVGEVFARQGFASRELVTRWPEIVGAEIAACAEPLKLNWPRKTDGDDPEPATLILRVEGPAAIEIQHLAPVILERVNRFIGWRAVSRIRLQQAPLARRPEAARPPPPSPEETEKQRARLADFGDEALRDALARLGAAVYVKR